MELKHFYKIPYEVKHLGAPEFYINFELFEKFVDEENPFEYYDQINQPDELEFKMELSRMMVLYSWWQIRKTKKFEEPDEEDREMLKKLIELSGRLWT